MIDVGLLGAQLWMLAHRIRFRPSSRKTGIRHCSAPAAAKLAGAPLRGSGARLLADLDERIALLRAEIARIEAARVAKQAAQGAADAFFKRG